MDTNVQYLAPARNSLQNGEAVDDNFQKDLNYYTSTNENISDGQHKVDRNDLQTIITPEITTSLNDLKTTYSPSCNVNKL